MAAIVGCAGQAPLVAPAVPAPAPGPRPARFAMPRPPFSAPADDAFHAQPSAAELAVTPPGTVMRYRRIAPRAYYLFGVPARAWQIAYRSSDTHGAPQADVATLLVPSHPNKRLLSYQVAYDGLTRRCAPSREILSGAMLEQLLVDKALARGWIVVLPDYEGPRAQFSAGINAGHGVLDAIRAAQAFLPNDLVDKNTRTALWGYSGGAYASLWAAQLAARYAPGLPIVGVAAGGAPGDLDALARHLDGGFFSAIYFAAIIGISRAYDDFDTARLLNAKGRRMFADLGTRCIGQELAWVADPLLSGYLLADIDDYTRVDDLLAVPAVKRIIAANSLGQRGFAAPLFYYQAFFDPIIPRRQSRALARRYCEQGVDVDFDYAIGEHFSAAITHAGDAVDYLAARFAGQPAPDECPKLLQAGSKPTGLDRRSGRRERSTLAPPRMEGVHVGGQ